MTFIVQQDQGSGPQDGLTSVAFPLIIPAHPAQRQIDIQQFSTVGTAMSPYTGATQSQEFPYEGWILDITLPPMRQNRARAWMAFLAALRGRYGSFLCGDQYLRMPQGTGAGTPLVNGANASRSRTLNIKGWTPGSLVLRSGDWMQVGTGETTRLHMNLTDVTADGSGNATHQIWPGLRESLSDGAAVKISDCQGTFKLAADTRKISIDQFLYTVTISAVEKL